MSRFASLERALGKEQVGVIRDAKVLVVGAGGIGCELLKNLVMTGFHNIEVIDLDTVDVSNLNRQFLFRRQHVGSSKSEVARESVLKFNPKATIVAHHGNIKNDKFDADYFAKFDVVINALDNLEARRHVNRVCLATEKPLVESGTQGYLGQATIIKGGVTECFECQPTPAPKKYPVCTLRATPSQPVHCLVWAKSIFATLFGPHDEDNILKDLKIEIGGDHSSSGAFAHKVFTQYFDTMIGEDRQKKERWVARTPPTQLKLDELLAKDDERAQPFTGPLIDQSVLSTAHTAQWFVHVVKRIVDERSDKVGTMEFDKDDELAMDFVTSAANLRMTNFGIETQSRFQAKGIAGNIVHAIATTNAIAAGLQVLEVLKVLSNKDIATYGRYTWIAPHAPRLLTPQRLEKPNADCIICAGGDVKVHLTVDTNAFTLRQLYTRVLHKHMHYNEPSVDVVTGNNAIGTMEDAVEDAPEYLDKPLAIAKITNGALVRVEDESQKLEHTLIIHHVDGLDEEEHPEGFLLKGEAAAKKYAEAKQRKLAAAAAAAAAATGDSQKQSKKRKAGDAPPAGDAIAQEEKRRKTPPSDDDKKDDAGDDNDNGIIMIDDGSDDDDGVIVL